ncbi:hypothetical protein QTP70_007655 [Hemibagrus guttatus]|uniref:Uncharacterized protein n=1 Tax=Hemibagrus guttatus TaxID=175788 RepID=A0AAE0RDC7_9TELE|nr:hypothetical protein QTP70_007655 [Hemibagrus guttatus]
MHSVISLLSGKTRLYEQQSAICASYETFSRELRKIFDTTIPQQDAVRMLFKTSQGSCSVVEFCTAAVNSGWKMEGMNTYIHESLTSIIRSSSSPAGAGFFFVKKKDKSLHPYNYQGLNTITVKNLHPLPLMFILLVELSALTAKGRSSKQPPTFQFLMAVWVEGCSCPITFGPKSSSGAIVLTCYAIPAFPTPSPSSKSIFGGPWSECDIPASHGIVLKPNCQYAAAYLDDVGIDSSTYSPEIRPREGAVARVLSHFRFRRAQIRVRTSCSPRDIVF